jgi:hypothetical protein
MAVIRQRAANTMGAASSVMVEVGSAHPTSLCIADSESSEHAGSIPAVSTTLGPSARSGLMLPSGFAVLARRDGGPISLYGREAPQRWPQHTAVTGMIGSCVRRDREVTSQQRPGRLGNTAIVGVPYTPVGDSRTDRLLLSRLWVSHAAQPCGRFDGIRKESRLKTRLTGSGRTEQNPQQRGPGCRENGTTLSQQIRGAAVLASLISSEIAGSNPASATLSSEPAGERACSSPQLPEARTQRRLARISFSSGRPLR